MYSDDFAIRLARLRIQKGVSARDMSLSIGQNAGYINNIESGKALPSMSAFFFICEYLGVTPAEFFSLEVRAPEKLRSLSENLVLLDDEQLECLSFLVKSLASGKKNK